MYDIYLEILYHSIDINMIKSNYIVALINLNKTTIRQYVFLKYLESDYKHLFGRYSTQRNQKYDLYFII